MTICKTLWGMLVFHGRLNNDEDGFEHIFLTLTSIDEIPNFIIGMEATGIFFENIYLYLKEKGFNVVLLYRNHI